MRQLVQNTNSLSIGKLSQNQIKIGSGSGSNVGIYFNNGNENLPGIRFLNSNEDEYIFHFDTSTGIFNSQSWPQGEEAIFYFKKYDLSTKRSGWIATSSTGVSLGLTGILNQESQWIIVRAYNIEDPASGPIVIAATATLPNLASWGSYGNVCTLEYIPPVKEWQYSNDGSNWFSIKPGKSSIDLSYELISITSSDLVDGIATIKHNLGQKYVLGLDYTVTPDNIEYTDENTLKLDYTKHENLNCKVWFYKSAQNMLVVPSSVEFLDEQYEGNLIANITTGTEVNKRESGDLIMTKESDGSWISTDGVWCLCGPDCCQVFSCWKHDNVWEIGCGIDGCNRYVGKTLPLNTNLVGYSADSDFEHGTSPILSLVIKKQIN